MADLKEFAKAYGKSVGEIAKSIGYTRQYLHLVFNSDHIIGTNRMYATLRLLKSDSDRMYQEQLKQAEKQKRERESYIVELARKCRLVFNDIDVLEQVE